MLFEETHSSWEGAVYRMASVVVGCLIGLIINYVFRKMAVTFHRQVSSLAVERGANDDKYDDDSE
jgi:hypothetical protein